MNQTENINDLVGALSKAQGVMRPAAYNKVNPHYKNRYADLSSCLDACREPLASNGLSVLQYVERQNNNDYLVTMLAHASGQWIKSYLPMKSDLKNAQALGSEMTYLKRYGISAMLGIVADEDQNRDDDGEIAVEQTKPPEPKPNFVEVVKKLTSEQIIILNDLLGKTTEDYRSVFTGHLKKAYGNEGLNFIPEAKFQEFKSRIENFIKLREEEAKV